MRTWTRTSCAPPLPLPPLPPLIPCPLAPLPGYLWHELYAWHNAGPIANSAKGLQPLLVHFENAETKRRMWVQGAE